MISAIALVDEGARAIMRSEAFTSLLPEVEEMYLRCTTRGAEQVRKLSAQFSAFAHSHDDMAFGARELAAIRARTLVVHGDRDEFFPAEIPFAMYRGIHTSELWIIPGGGHVPIYDPMVPFTARALDFLGRTPTTRATQP